MGGLPNWLDRVDPEHMAAVDACNPLVQPGPVGLATVLMRMPKGDTEVMVTVRNMGGTMTVWLTEAEAQAFGEQLVADAAKIRQGRTGLWTPNGSGHV